AGGEGPALHLIHRRGRRPLWLVEDRQILAGQQGHFVRPVLIVNATDHDTQMGHGTSPGNDKGIRTMGLFCHMAAASDHQGTDPSTYTRYPVSRSLPVPFRLLRAFLRSDWPAF